MAATPGRAGYGRDSTIPLAPLRSPGSSAANQHNSFSGGIPKNRTSHACDRCRLMRTKCSGGHRCTKCTKDNAVCAYGDRKRERNKKDLAESVERVGQLEDERNELLNALRAVAGSPDFNNAEYASVVELLSRYSIDEQTGSTQGSSSQSRSRSQPEASAKEEHSMSSPSVMGRPDSTRPTGEKHVPSSVGSPGQQGELAQVVNLDEGTGASGFVGKMSELSWIQRAREYLLEPPTQMLGHMSFAEMDMHSAAAKDLNYYMDDTNVLEVDEDLVDAHQWPPFQVALILSEAYFHAMQGAFHFVHREQFLHALVRYPQSKSIPSWVERRWLGLANLIWAIGSKWLHMTKLDDQNFPESHLVFYARARALGVDHRILFDHPDVEQIQTIGLLAFYLLVNGSIARAWTTLGHALRHATALGLHLRVTDPNIHRVEQERRARTWYSLYSLEVLIAELTGRPKSVSLADVTIPLETLTDSQNSRGVGSGMADSFLTPAQSRKMWLDFLSAERDLPQGMTGGVVPWRSFAAVGQQMSPAHFAEHIRICIISDKIAGQLYAGPQSQPWSETQDRIGDLQSELKNWVDYLPDELNIQSVAPSGFDPRSKIELSMYHHSVEMILHRLCLCEVHIPDQSERSLEFNRSSARACVHAAMSLLAVMPDSPTSHEAYQLLPWWNLLHYICQATVVLILELCLDAQHFPDEIHVITGYLRKAMAYLWCMAEGSPSAYKAWRIFRRLLTDVSVRYDDLGIADIPVQAPPPLAWTEEHERSLMEACM